MSTSNRLYKQSQRLPKHQPISWKRYLLSVVLNDAVLWASFVLAAVSVPLAKAPLSAYPAYFDFRTLACLFSLMAASGGFMIAGVFDQAAARIVMRNRNTAALMASMVGAVFLSSMFITNDVALIVFVPMTLIAYRRTGQDPMMAIVLETVAANIGSSLLPIGNPQNLFLFSRFDMEFSDFIRTVGALGVVGAALLLLFCLAAKRTGLPANAVALPKFPHREILPYALLFAAAILAVFDRLDYRLVFAAAVMALLVKGRNLAQQVDYTLLLTFSCFFVFVGNISRIPRVGELLSSVVGPSPFAAAVVASQVISNVPAAVLLSEFTTDAQALLAGVTAGGCGTLIASMANLISYKLYARGGGGRIRYILAFTLVNAFFLAVLSITWVAIR